MFQSTFKQIKSSYINYIDRTRKLLSGILKARINFKGALSLRCTLKAHSSRARGRDAVETFCLWFCELSSVRCNIAVALCRVYDRGLLAMQISGDSRRRSDVAVITPGLFSEYSTTAINKVVFLGANLALNHPRRRSTPAESYRFSLRALCAPAGVYVCTGRTYGASLVISALVPENIEETLFTQTRRFRLTDTGNHRVVDVILSGE